MNNPQKGCYVGCYYYTDSCFSRNCMKGKSIIICEGYHLDDEKSETCSHKKDGKCTFFSNIEYCNYDDIVP